MTALIIVDLTVIDKEKLMLYSAAAAQTLVRYKGEFIAKGAIEILHGESHYKTKVVIQFPDKASATNWYESAEYQKIIPIREQGITSQFHLIG